MAGPHPITVGHTIYAFKEGGMERGLLNIINHGDEGRFRHIILCLTEAGEFARHIRPRSCRVIEFHKGPGNDICLIGKLAKAVRQYGIDILHARGWPTLLETAAAARLTGVRATIYGFHGKTAMELGGLSLLRRVAQAVAVRTYDRLVTLNRRMRDDFAKESYVSSERIQVIANGVDHRNFTFRHNRQIECAKCGIPIDRFVLGNVARLDPVKNHEVILKALALFPAGHTRPYLLLVGEGELRPFLEKRIVEMGLERDVGLFGFSNDTAALFGCMDVYVQSSFYEGFSNTVLEAMSSGLPILATDVGGTRDLVSEGKEGLFFMPSDATRLHDLVRQLRDDCQLRASMGHSAQLRVLREFTLEKMIASYETLYRALT